MGSASANDVYNFVPDGSPVKVTRYVVPTAVCNGCHDPMIGHGGSRITVELCILCHTPQTINPDTLHSQDMPVLIHKIHMGKNLPSVKAGTPYRIWHRGALVGLLRRRLPVGRGRVEDLRGLPPEGSPGRQSTPPPRRAPPAAPATTT